MTLASQDEPTVAIITEWLLTNAATMEVSVSKDSPSADPEMETRITLKRAGKPDLVGKAFGDISFAFQEAIKGA
jgi:hypothetical protein